MATHTIPNDVEPTRPLVVVTLTNIIKLTSTNFLSWKLQLQATLVGYGLFSFLDGSRPCPAQHLPTASAPSASAPSPNPAYTTLVRQDQLLFGAIIGTLDSSIVPLVSRAATAHEAWTILSHTFARNSCGHAKLLKANFRNITKGSKTIPEYMNAIRVCADHLAILGEPVPPEDLIERVLDGLRDPAFTPVVDATNARDTLISFDELHEKLLVREVHLLNNPTTTPTPLPATALAAVRPPSYPSNSHPRHTSSPTPPTKPNYSKKPSSSKPSGYQGKCQWCHTVGHSLYRCTAFHERFPHANPTLPPSSTSTSPQAHAAALPSSSTSNSWLLDSGASHHVTNDLANLSLHSPYDGSEEIIIGNGVGVPITHTGTLSLPTPSSSLTLSNVLCAPSMTRNLISISQLCRDNNILIEFSSDSFLMKDRQTGQHLFRGPPNHGIYELPPSSSKLAYSTIKSSAIDWHHRLGHPSLAIFNKLVSQFHLNVAHSSTFHCNACHCNKSHKLPFCQSTLISTKPLELIYTDLWTSPVHSHDGFKYYVIFVDHFTKYIWFYPLKKKSDTAAIFRRYKALVEKYFAQPIITLYSDNGGEYEALSTFLTIDGVSHLTSPPIPRNITVLPNAVIGTSSKPGYLSSPTPNYHSSFGLMPSPPPLISSTASLLPLSRVGLPITAFLVHLPTISNYVALVVSVIHGFVPTPITN